MKTLQVLSTVLENERSPALDTWLAANKDTDEVKLYRGIVNGDFESDEAANAVLFNDVFYYDKIKISLKKTLLEFLRYLPFNNETQDNHKLQQAKLAFALATLTEGSTESASLAEIQQFFK